MSYETYTDATLFVLSKYPEGINIRAIENDVAILLNLTRDEISIPYKNDSRSSFQYRLAWVRTRLKNEGLATNVARGVWALTRAGLEYTHIRDLRGYVSWYATDQPLISEPLPGMDWRQDANTGLLAPSPPATPLSAVERRELESLLPLLIDAARDLVDLLGQSRSNSAQRIAPIAEKYLAAVSREIGILSIDELFAAGVRLRNAQHRLALEVLEEGFPELSVEIGEAFDSTLGLHGPCFLSTQRGNELARRARDDMRTRADELEFKLQAEKFVVKLRETRNLVTDEGKEFVEQVVAEVGSGPQPERSTAVAEATTQTLLVRLAKIVISEIGKESFKLSALGVGAIAFSAARLNASVEFLNENSDSLRLLAAATGESLSWLPNFLSWVDAKIGITTNRLTKR